MRVPCRSGRRLLQHAPNQLIQDRWQKRARWFVVQPFAHQSHWLSNSQTIAQAPPKQLAVTCGKKQSWSGEFFCRADERFYIRVCLAHGVPKKTNDRRVTANPTLMLNNGGRASRDRVAQLSVAVVPVHVPADAITGFDVRFSRWPDDMPFDSNVERVTLHARQVFTNVVAKFRIQRQ